MVQRYIILLISVLFLAGCVDLRPLEQKDKRYPDPIIVYPSVDSNYLLSCLSDMKSLDQKGFKAEFSSAEAGLEYGRNLDKLRFICLSINEKADYKQFQHGMKVLEQYFEDNPEAGEDMLGFRYLVDRLNEEILNRWSAWKSLLNDKKELKAEVVSLNARIEELNKQIEQLKNIEKIIKSRGVSQP
jgi:hypothetical protein